MLIRPSKIIFGTNLPIAVPLIENSIVKTIKRGALFKLKFGRP